jgi:hypothetical protein
LEFVERLPQSDGHWEVSKVGGSNQKQQTTRVYYDPRIDLNLIKARRLGLSAMAAKATPVYSACVIFGVKDTCGGVAKASAA